MNMIETAYRQFCEERFPLPSEQEVAALEERIGIRLPEDYRRYILNYNGGYFTEPEIVPPSKECPLDRLTSMNGIGATYPSEDLASDADLALFTDNDPPQILPIGYTLMGNLLFVITHPEGRGTIAMKLASKELSCFLAKGIEEFFGLLREPTEE